MAEERIHRAVSADGTEIVGRVHGSGRSVVLLPAGPGDSETSWSFVLPHLSTRFTCYVMNTRGRGHSTDHPDHSPERLVEDITAFVESIGDTFEDTPIALQLPARSVGTLGNENSYSGEPRIVISGATSTQMQLGRGNEVLSS